MLRGVVPPILPRRSLGSEKSIAIMGDDGLENEQHVRKTIRRRTYR